MHRPRALNTELADYPNFSTGATPRETRIIVIGAACDGDPPDRRCRPTAKRMSQRACGPPCEAVSVQSKGIPEATEYLTANLPPPRLSTVLSV